MHDLAAFVLQLHFLVGIVIVHTGADVGHHVAGDLAGEDLGLHGLAGGQSVQLFFQLYNTGLAGTGHGLIGAGYHALNGGQLVQGVDGHGGDDGGAVGVGNDAVMLESVLGVDLGHNQRNVGVHTEGGGVVNEDGACLDDIGGKLPGEAAAYGTQYDIHTLEGIGSGFAHDDLFAAEGDSAACAAGRGQRQQGGNGEVALFQNLQHFTAHGTGGAQNGNVIFLHRKWLLS